MIRYCLALEVAGSPAYAEIEQILEGRPERPDVIYLWADHTVTMLPLPDSDQLLVPDDDHWHEFCAQALRAGQAA